MAEITTHTSNSWTPGLVSTGALMLHGAGIMLSFESGSTRVVAPEVVASMYPAAPKATKHPKRP